MFWQSLGFRLLVVVGTALAIGLSLFLYFSMGNQERALIRLKEEEAHLLSETVKRSLHHAMLQGDDPAFREGIHAVIREIGTRPQIERIRIFNAVGGIQFSSDPSEIGHTVDKDAEGCKQCHAGGKLLRPETERSRTRRFFYNPPEEGAPGYGLLGVINPIYNEPVCARCHHGQTVLGVLDVVVTLESLEKDFAVYRKSIAVFGVAGIAGILAVVAILIHFLVSRPVAVLVDGTRKVGELNLDYRIPAERDDEIGNLARAFNVMTGRLKQAQERIRDFTDSLERKVEEKTQELRAAQDRVVHSEKMAAIGQMAAGVAHEINNPLTGVITFAHLLRPKHPEGSRERGDLDTIIREAERCSKIVRGLLDFARGGNLDRRAAHLNDILDRVLALVEHQASFHDIEIVRNYGDVPRLDLDADQMQQVFLNLVMNAAEAMGEGGRLTVTTETVAEGEHEEVRAEIADTGTGIEPDALNRIFDPFFSTKETGKGTGLGLSVSYRIVADHGGKILVSSRPGEGTRFSVVLPVRSDEPLEPRGIRE